MPTRVFQLENGPAYVQQTISVKQDGACRFCHKKFFEGERIVSNGKRRKYYHIECAKRLNIVVLLSKDLHNMKPRILLVDDEHDIVVIFQKFLELSGFDVDAFENPKNALEKYKSNHYDILLFDIKMAEMSGFELYSAITKIELTRKLPICFISAYSDLINEAKKYIPELNDDNIVRKPVKLDSLFERISILI